MSRRTNSLRPYRNATSLYGWGYNGSAGPGSNRESQIGRPDAIGFEHYGQEDRESFWDYCFAENTAFMGRNSEAGSLQGDRIFGGLGIGIDFPLYLGWESATYDPEVLDNPGLIDGIDSKNELLGRLKSHVPLPVRLDDYGDKKFVGNVYVDRWRRERLGRESWVKIQGGVADCLGIKTHGLAVSTSGNLYGWGLGEYNGGPAHHASMRYWSCVPEIIDSSSDRYFVDTESYSIEGIDGNYAYLPDSDAAIAAHNSTNTHTSSGWTDIASMNRHRGSETEFQGNSWYAGIKDGNLYTWGYKPLGKSQSLESRLQHKIGRVFHVVTSVHPTQGPLKNHASISGIQPTYTKVFGGNNNFAALDSDGMLYFVGKHNRLKQSRRKLSVATCYYPSKLSTVDGDTGFSWYDANYYDMSVIQNGKIFYAEPTTDRVSFINHTGVFTELDDSTSAGHGWAGTSGWTQVHSLGWDNKGKSGGVVALNASGQMWIRPTTADRNYALLKSPPISAEFNKWSMLSPTGVVFKKIILNPTKVTGPNACYQIMGLTDKGELYTTDNTYGQIFPYIDPYPDRSPATPDGNTCPYDAEGNLDSTYTVADLANYNNQRDWATLPSGFVKIKPLQNGSDGVWWDQVDYPCDQKVGWPINHPAWIDNQEGYSYSRDKGATVRHRGYSTYSWGLEYKNVDGADTLRYLPVKDRTNLHNPFNTRWERLPPVLEWRAEEKKSIIDIYDNRNFDTHGLIDTDFNFIEHGDFTTSINYSENGVAGARALSCNKDGSIIAVGSPEDSGNAGAVSVYRLIGATNNPSDGTWTMMGEPITCTTATSGFFSRSHNEFFGKEEAVALSSHSSYLGDSLDGHLTIAIGSPHGGVDGSGTYWNDYTDAGPLYRPEAGEVYVYVWDDIEGWSAKGVVNPGGGSQVSHPITWGSYNIYDWSNNEFGHSVKINASGDHIVVGKPGQEQAHQTAPHGTKMFQMGGLNVFEYKDLTENVSNAEFKAEVLEAMAVWKEALEGMCSWLTVTFTDIGDETGTSVPSDASHPNYSLPHAQNIGDIRVGMHLMNNPATLGHAWRAHGILGSTGSAGGDLHFDSADRWRRDHVVLTKPVPGRPGHFTDQNGVSVKWVAVHEMGHVLGMGHLEDEDAVMYAYAHPAAITNGAFDKYYPDGILGSTPDYDALKTLYCVENNETCCNNSDGWLEICAVVHNASETPTTVNFNVSWIIEGTASQEAQNFVTLKDQSGYTWVQKGDDIWYEHYHDNLGKWPGAGEGWSVDISDDGTRVIAGMPYAGIPSNCASDPRCPIIETGADFAGENNYGNVGISAVYIWNEEYQDWNVSGPCDPAGYCYKGRAGLSRGHEAWWKHSPFDFYHLLRPEFRVTGKCDNYKWYPGSHTQMGRNVAMAGNGRTWVTGEIFGDTGAECFDPDSDWPCCIGRLCETEVVKCPATRSGRAWVAFAPRRFGKSNVNQYDSQDRLIKSSHEIGELKEPLQKWGQTQFGASVGISYDGSWVIVGSPGVSQSNANGAIHVFKDGVIRQSITNKDHRELAGRETSSLGYACSISDDASTIFAIASSTDYEGNNPEHSWSRWLSWKYLRDPTTAWIEFRHPRRALTGDKDFLWDGQDVHNFTDGWEDLTVCRWSQYGFNKYWGTR
jgi:hypothetical protein